jgi:hypothetical protein
MGKPVYRGDDPNSSIDKARDVELRSNMGKHKKTVSAAFVITMLVSPWPVPEGIVAQ